MVRSPTPLRRLRAMLAHFSAQRPFALPDGPQRELAAMATLRDGLTAFTRDDVAALEFEVRRAGLTDVVAINDGLWPGAWRFEAAGTSAQVSDAGRLEVVQHKGMRLRRGSGVPGPRLDVGRLLRMTERDHTLDAALAAIDAALGEPPAGAGSKRAARHQGHRGLDEQALACIEMFENPDSGAEFRPDWRMLDVAAKLGINVASLNSRQRNGKYRCPGAMKKWEVQKRRTQDRRSRLRRPS